MAKKIVFSSILVLVLLTASIYLVFNDEFKIDIQKTRTQYFFDDNGSWELASTEYVYLYDGATKMRATSRSDVITWNNSQYIWVQKNATFKDGITTSQTYKFNKEGEDITSFPLENKFTCNNCEGKIVHYEVRDLLYTGETKSITSPFDYGNKMRIEFDETDDFSWAKVYQSKTVSDKIVVRYRPDEGVENYFVRITDPPQTTKIQSVTAGNMADISHHSTAYSTNGFQIRWNISVVPTGQIITEAIMCTYIPPAGKVGTPDTDGRAWRVVDQTWTESISASSLSSQTLANQTTLTLSSTTTSTYTCYDVTDIISTDYELDNTYSTVRVEDPDYLVTAYDAADDGIGLGFGNFGVHGLSMEDREGTTGTTNYPYLNVTYYPETETRLNLTDVEDDVWYGSSGSWEAGGQIKFNISEIPDNVVIEEARLWLWSVRGDNPTNNVSVQRVDNQGWSETDGSISGTVYNQSYVSYSPYPSSTTPAYAFLDITDIVNYDYLNGTNEFTTIRMYHPDYVPVSTTSYDDQGFFVGDVYPEAIYFFNSDREGTTEGVNRSYIEIYYSETEEDDTDGDGVSDSADICSATDFGGACSEVDANGCCSDAGDTMYLRRPDIDILEDADFTESTTRDGSNWEMEVDLLDGTGGFTMFKFNISAVPAGVTITNTTIEYQLRWASQDTFDIGYSNNQTWLEEDLDDTCATVYCSELDRFFTSSILTDQTGNGTSVYMKRSSDLSSAVETEIAAENDAVTYWFNHTDSNSQYYMIASKEATNEDIRPSLEIEYEFAEGCVVLDTADSTHTLTDNLIHDASGPCLNVTAENVTIDGAGFTIYNYTTTHPAIYSNQPDTTIKNISINLSQLSTGSGCDRSIGICLDSADRANITGVNIESTRFGIYFYTSDNVTVESSTSNNASGQNFIVNGGTGVNISNSNFSDSTAGNGVFLLGGSDHRLDNVLASDNAGNGVYVSGSDNNIIINSVFNDNTYAGVSLENSEYNLVDYTSASNTENGVYMSGANYSNITNGNYSHSTSYSGISMVNSHHNLIQNNTNDYNNFDCVRVESSSDNIIENNTAIGDETGIYLELGSSRNIIRNNNITGTAIYHALSINSNSDDNIFSNNILHDSDQYAIWIDDVDNNTFEDNDISGCSLDAGDYGCILVVGNSEYNVFARNNIDSSSNDGIKLVANDGASTIRHNMFRDFTITSSTDSDVFVNFATSPASGNITFLNVTYDTEEKFSGSLYMDITRKWYADVTVINSTDNLVGANVTIYDNADDVIHTSLTDSNGEISQQILTDYIVIDTGARTFSGPHSFNVTLDGYNDNSTIVNLTDIGNADETILLGAVASDTCTCAGAGNNWEINMEDMCTLSSSCTVANISWTGSSGYFICDAQLTIDNRNAPPSGTTFYFYDECEISRNV